MSGKGRWAKKKNKYLVKDEIYKRLTYMLKLGEGTSRHKDKKWGLDRGKIYSYNTYQTYHQQCKKYAEWCKNNPKTQDIKRLDPLLDYVDDYLQYLIDNNYSAWTITTAKAALTKLYQVEGGYFIDTPSRYRKDIKRSRGGSESRVSPKTEAIYAKFTSATGLRREELEKVRGIDLRKYKDRYYIQVFPKSAKGGKPRIALILGKTKEETQEIVDFIKEQGKLKLFPSVPKHLDNHQYRAKYAKRIYNAFARDVSTLSFSEKYCPRGDLKGQWMDRRAMLIASKYLGHERLDEISKSYLWA